MVVQNKKLEKTCCFYVSEFHLEMILVPYIKEKINENITILTEIKLKETLQILISRMNLTQESKEKILKLEWDGDKSIKENSHVIIVGSNQYIEEKNKELENKNIASILHCYNFEEEKENINYISNQYKNILNTLGKNNF